MILYVNIIVYSVFYHIFAWSAPSNSYNLRKSWAPLPWQGGGSSTGNIHSFIHSIIHAFLYIYIYFFFLFFFIIIIIFFFFFFSLSLSLSLSLSRQLALFYASSENALYLGIYFEYNDNILVGDCWNHSKTMANVIENLTFHITWYTIS